jgi:hypothetical protein
MGYDEIRVNVPKFKGNERKYSAWLIFFGAGSGPGSGVDAAAGAPYRVLNEI